MKKNFLKKLVTGVLAATLGVTALVGCGSAKTADKGDQVYRTLDEIKDSGGAGQRFRLYPMGR